MRIAVCDDEQREREALFMAIQSQEKKNKVELFSKGAAFLEAAKEKPFFDLVFLDIYMPGEHGLRVAKELQKISPNTGIVFTTTSTDHAIEAFELDAVHYLVKPVSGEKIKEVFARMEKKQSENNPVLVVTSARRSQMLYQREIAMLTSNDHETVITMKDGREVSTYTPISQLLSELDASFLLLQRGMVVQMDFIERMQSDKCSLKNGQVVLLSRKERGNINQVYNNYIFNRLSDQMEGGR